MNPHRRELSSGVSGSAKSRNKTQLCKSFSRMGQCKYGDNCKYAHSFEGGQSAFQQNISIGSEGEGRSLNASNESMPRVGICTFFYSTGQCPYGNKCKYEHQKAEGDQDMNRGSSAILIQTTDLDARTNSRLKAKTKLCHSWMRRNACAKGANCTFAHGEAELVQSPPVLDQNPEVW